MNNLFSDSEIQDNIENNLIDTSVDFNIMSGNFNALIGLKIAQYYNVEKVLGSGGMSVVLLATQELLQKQYAIKMLLPHLLSNEITLQRFQNEGRSLVELSHPNIINIHNFGTINDSIPYLIMDYIEGYSLSDLISQNKYLPQIRALNIFKQIASALSHAHHKKIIHRDLKPSNVMVLTNENDKVKILDFGIAKMLTEVENIGKLTKTGDIFGSPYYMSPEQCRGDKLDERSDIYSMGCLMYETLAGKPPLVGNNLLESLHMQLNEIPKSFNKVNPSLKIKSSLESIVFKALAKDPNNRYQTMDALLNDLNNIKTSQENIFDILINNYILWRLQLKKISSQEILIIGISLIILLSLCAFGSFEYGNLNQIYKSVAWQKDIKLVNYRVITKVKPSDENIFSLDSEIKTITDKVKCNTELGESVENAHDLINYAINSNLNDKAIELYIDLLADTIKDKYSFKTQFNSVQFAYNFFQLSRLVAKYYPDDYVKPIGKIAGFQILTDKLSALGDKSIINMSLRDLDIKLMIIFYQSTRRANFTITNNLITDLYLTIANSFYINGQTNESLRYYEGITKFLELNKLDSFDKIKALSLAYSRIGNINLKTSERMKTIQYKNVYIFNGIKALELANGNLTKLSKEYKINNDELNSDIARYNIAINHYRMAKLSLDNLKEAIKYFNLSLIDLDDLMNNTNNNDLKNRTFKTILLIKLKFAPYFFKTGDIVKAWSYYQDAIFKTKEIIK